MGRFVRKTLLFAFFSLLLVACNKVPDRRVELENEHDSISFAVSMLISESMPETMDEIGIDGSTLPYFLLGMRDAFPVDDSPEAIAYAQGVLVAASAMEMLERADEAVYPGDTVKKVDRKMFLEGMIATAYGTGKTMTTKQAVDYYNHRIFRSASEAFIAKCKERPDVKALPSGLLYKVEQMGDGPVAGYNDKVLCIYKAAYPNGAVLATSRGNMVEFDVDNVFDGLAEALTTLPAGTACKLYIPWNLAYGAEGTEKVPPYSALVYDLEIKAVVGK